MEKELKIKNQMTLIQHSQQAQEENHLWGIQEDLMRIIMLKMTMRTMIMGKKQQKVKNTRNMAKGQQQVGEEM